LQGIGDAEFHEDVEHGNFFDCEEAIYYDAMDYHGAFDSAERLFVT